MEIATSIATEVNELVDASPAPEAVTNSRPKRWYVVHAFSGFEKSIQRALVDRIARSDFADQFGQVLVPVEEVVEIKNGQKKTAERKFFPGYILVEMDMTDDSWHLVKSTPKVSGFIGGSDAPCADFAKRSRHDPRTD
jgi:transcription termination/antitermination protein NusG